MLIDRTTDSVLLAVLAQTLGIIAMCINILSFQWKEKKHIVLMQFCSSMFYALNLFLLGAPMGFFLNLIGMIRAVVCYFGNFFHAEHKFWFFVFPLLSVCLYVGTFTVFGTEPTAGNLVLEFLPVVGMTITTIGFFLPRAKDVRLLSLINSPPWLIYHAFAHSIGGVLGEVFVMTSIIIGMLRHDRETVK